MRFHKISFLFVLLLCYHVLNAQKYTNYQFVVFSYSVDIDERVQQELRTVEGSINYNPINKQSKVEAFIIHNIYNMVTKTLADSLKIFFLPANYFGEKVKLNDYGYPEIVIQKAIRLADLKYYMKIEASVSSSKYDEKGKKITDNSFIPVVSVSIDIYNKFGFNPIQSSEGQAMAVKPVTISHDFIAGLNFVSPTIIASDGSETLERMINKAVYESLFGIMYKKPK